MGPEEPSIYRPRNPRHSPLWQCVKRHLPGLRGSARMRRAIEQNVFERFLRCGDLHFGFARIGCSSCGRDLLLAFSCKTRYFCPSCHQKRVLAYGDWVETSVLRPVAHRQYVFTVPKLLRPFFAYRRALLGELCRIIARLLSDAYKAAHPRGRPAFILFVQTFGDLVNFNPHVHALVADGVFEPDERFTPLPAIPEALLAQRLRRELLALLARKEVIAPALARQMFTWRHSGFTVHNQVRVAAGDREGRKSLAGYMLRAPFSLEKTTYDPKNGTILYRSKLHVTLKRNFQVMPGEQWLELLCKHIPDRYEHMVRYYGRYSSRTRGAQREQPDIDGSDAETVSHARQAAKAAWAKLIRKVYEVDPLLCKCGTQMRVIALIEDPAVIERILSWLGLWDPLPLSGPSPPRERASLPLTYDPVPDIA